MRVFNSEDLNLVMEAGNLMGLPREKQIAMCKRMEEINQILSPGPEEPLTEQEGELGLLNQELTQVVEEIEQAIEIQETQIVELKSKIESKNQIIADQAARIDEYDAKLEGIITSEQQCKEDEEYNLKRTKELDKEVATKTNVYIKSLRFYITVLSVIFGEYLIVWLIQNNNLFDATKSAVKDIIDSIQYLYNNDGILCCITVILLIFIAIIGIVTIAICGIRKVHMVCNWRLTLIIMIGSFIPIIMLAECLGSTGCKWLFGWAVFNILVFVIRYNCANKGKVESKTWVVVILLLVAIIMVIGGIVYFVEQIG